jgi:hypothetical protein
MARGNVKFKLGSDTYTCRVPLTIAPQIEAEFEMGMLSVARKLRDMTATSIMCVGIIRLVLAENNKPLEDLEIYERLQTSGGLAEVYKIANSIIEELFFFPSQRGAKAGNAAAAESAAN